MFINKKEKLENSTISTASDVNPILNKPKTVVAIENFPVHTMQADLNKTAAVENNTYSQNKNQASQELPVSNETKATPKTSIILFAIMAVFVFILIVGGGYYFWVTRIKNSSDIAHQPIEDPSVNETTDTQPEIVAPTLPVFSETQPNFLSLDIQNASPATLQENLKKIASEVVGMKTIKSIEFIITDQLNNPVNFADFTKKFGILLPPSILSQLTGSFSLYAYNDNSYPHFGFSASVKNNSTLKTAMIQEEGNLLNTFSPLFMTPNYDLKNATSFQSSLYKGTEIRYVNIPSAEAMSIDYSTSDNRLIIGTSKLTMRAIIDHYLATAQPTN